MAHRRQQQQQQDAYMQNGHIVRKRKLSNGIFSWFRFIIIVSFVSFLIVTNPANNNNYFNTKTTSSSLFFNRGTTNFGLFSIQERTIKSIVQIGGYQWQCPYFRNENNNNDDIFDEYKIIFCKDFLGNYLSHGKPLLYDRNDRVYTVYRITLWIIVIGTFFTLCYIKIPTRFNTGIGPFNSFLSMIMDEDPISGMIWKITCLQLYLYPVLQAFSILIPKQASNSLFAIFDTDDQNFIWTCTIFFLLAIGINESSKLWSGSYLLRFDCITGLAIGYYTDYLSSSHEILGRALFYPFHIADYEVNWAMVSWTTIFILLRKSHSPFSTLIFFSMSCLVGQILSEYHYNNLIYVVSARAFVDTINDIAQNVEDTVRGLLNFAEQKLAML